MAQEIEQFEVDKSSNGLDGKEARSSTATLERQIQQVSAKENLSPSSPAEKSPMECWKLSRNNNIGESKEITQPKISPPQGMEANPSNKPAEIFRTSCRTLDTPKVHGFENEEIALQKLLLQRENNNDFKSIGVVGMAGIGKTTLCQVIFNKEEVKKHFLPRIWVCMSRETKEEDTDPKVAIVKRLLYCLGVEMESIESIFTHGFRGLLYALHLQLVGKRYLIVLDDAREAETDGWCENLGYCLPPGETWGDKLAFGLPKGFGGSVIVTTRSKQVAKKMVGEENLFPILPFSDPESFWPIFIDSVERDGIKFDSTQNLKEELLLKCAGLPLAAKLMGQLKFKELQIKGETAPPPIEIHQQQ